MIKDIKKEYPEAEIDEGAGAAGRFWNCMRKMTRLGLSLSWMSGILFFHQNFISENNKRDYLTFLRNLLKDRPYVRLAYMTGILPIAKYSSGSELNMFSEFTMASEERFSEYFGFTEKEVDLLFLRYQERTERAKQVTREGLSTGMMGIIQKQENGCIIRVLW